MFSIGARFLIIRSLPAWPKMHLPRNFLWSWPVLRLEERSLKAVSPTFSKADVDVEVITVVCVY